MIRLPLAILANLLLNLWRLPRVVWRALLGRPQWVVLELEGQVPLRSPRGWFRWSGRKRLSVADIDRLVQRVEHDRKVPGLVVILRHLSVGFATLQALALALDRLRASGKQLVFHLHDVGTREVALAAAGDRVLTQDGTLLDLRGLSVELSFLGEGLDRLGVDVEVGRAGRYKSAAERLTRCGISEANREALQRLLEVCFAWMVERIARGRSLTSERVRELIDEGPYLGRSAQRCGLVDGLIYEDDLDRWLSPAGLRSEPADERSRARLVPARRYLTRGRLRYYPLLPRRRVAIVSLSGPLMSRPAGLPWRPIINDAAVRPLLQALGRDQRVAAVVLLIDSPGGSSSTSDAIWWSIRRLREHKPVVAALGNVAASGGYYIASACDRVFAQSLSMTGSIGVLAGKLNLERLFQRIGVHGDSVRLGRRSALFSVHEGFDEDGKQALHTLLDETYALFIERVSEGRELSREAIEQVAEGRVWIGEDALGVQLVDDLGGLRGAIEEASRRGRHNERERLDLVDLRPPRSPRAR